MSKQDLVNLNLEELKEYLMSIGEKPFRAKQIFRQIWRNHVSTFDEMTDLNIELRKKLKESATIGTLQLLNVKTGDIGLTKKAIWKTIDDKVIESVLMIYPNRSTVCVSSQAGCPMGCIFCATGKLGLLKNLSAGEIAEQALWAARTVKEANNLPIEENRHNVSKENFPEALTNVVYMGMGEPFNNYNKWWRSVELLNHKDGFNLGARSFTVSTVGLVPGIEKLSNEDININLAISLHTPFDSNRSELMPVNKKYPIATLIQASKKYVKDTGRRVSFEYCLIRGQNDSEDDAIALAYLLTKPEKFPCHVNLIPWNPVNDTGLKTITKESRENFRKILKEHGIPTTFRIERGRDIDAACGQLGGEYQNLVSLGGISPTTFGFSAFKREN